MMFPAIFTMKIPYFITRGDEKGIFRSWLFHQKFF